MNKINIYDKDSFIRFITLVDKNNVIKYLNLLSFYDKNSIHNVYKISSYIFNKIDFNNINNLYCYFAKSLSENIKKLDNYSKNNESIPNWFYHTCDSEVPSDYERQEIIDLLSKF